MPGGDGRTAALYGCLHLDPHWTAGAAWSPPSRDVGWTGLRRWRRKRKGTKPRRKGKRRREKQTNGKREVSPREKA